MDKEFEKLYPSNWFPILEKKNMKEAPPKLHTCTNISLKLVIALNMRGKTVILYIVRDSEKKTIG